LLSGKKTNKGEEKGTITCQEKFIKKSRETGEEKKKRFKSFVPQKKKGMNLLGGANPGGGTNLKGRGIILTGRRRSLAPVLAVKV